MIQLKSRWTVAPLLFFAMVLSGCQGPDKTPEAAPVTPAPTALTWTDYARKEVPRREVTDPYYPVRGAGLPDMSLWRPEDFLTQEQIDSPHTDLCELPLDERTRYNILDDQIGAHPEKHQQREVVEQVLVDARAGLIQAQAALGNICLWDRDYKDLGITEAELYDFMRKGAASGNAHAAASLAHCIEIKVKQGELPQKDLLVDEMLYWYWRSSQTLEFIGSVSMHTMIGSNFFMYPTYLENNLHDYKWSRLLDFLETYQDEPSHIRLYQVYGREHFQTTHELTDEQMAMGDQLVTDWLLTYPDAFKNHREPMGCPDLSWRDGDEVKFNQVTLDEALKPFLQESKK
ncbi:MAG: hypothetical protein GY770_06450 [Aestuariibacter sp.]|nr:hypothetical protein [Aestuariibacter sp.]